jgi:6,7-dimethyl-8-ribityllumazine synthase
MAPRPVRIAVVASRFNAEVVDRMVEVTLAYAKERGAKVVEVLRVPGAFEIPFALQEVLGRADIDGAVAVGAVVKGETEHDEVIMEEVTRKIMDLSLQFRKPVGLGVSGPGMSWEQAMARVGYGKRAVDAVVELVALRRSSRSRR